MKRSRNTSVGVSVWSCVFRVRAKTTMGDGYDGSTTTVPQTQWRQPDRRPPTQPVGYLVGLSGVPLSIFLPLPPRRMRCRRLDLSLPGCRIGLYLAPFRDEKYWLPD